MPLDEWQEVALEAAMGERSDGRWAAKYVGISAPRQNGKSQLIVARALAGVLLFGEKMIIISAHETDTAREVWKRLIDVIEDDANPTLAARVTGRMDAINREFISFGVGKDRQTIKLKARRASGARGFSADCLLLDEAQILGKHAWGSINPTMSAMPNPQLWLFGTPPTEADEPFAFSRVRDNARAGKARHTWLEWAAEPSEDFDAPETWAKANPAYGVRISEEACADDRAAMDDEQFALERLGIWPTASSAVKRAFSGDVWRDLTISAPGDWPVAAVGLDMDASGRIWCAVALHGPDPSVHVELLPEDLLAQGSDAAVRRIVERCRKRLPVVVPYDSGADVLTAPLIGKGVKVYRLNIGELAQASAGMVQAMKDGEVSHIADPLLEKAIGEATREDLKTGWRIGRTGEWSGAPEYAVACARFGAVKWSKRQAYSGRAVRGGAVRGPQPR